ncbi:MAG: hypothetical protein JXQ99_16245, partial [Hyphomicrobiaceae bacterium]
MAEHLIRVGQVWHYKRRVPAELNHADPRRVVQRSTGKRDRAEALVVARRFDEETERYWETLSDPRSASNQATDRYEAALKRARSLGYQYRDVQQLADGPLEELLARIEKLERDRLVTSAPAVEAVFGGVPKPVIRVSELCERYFAIARDKVRGKSDNQIRKWRAPRNKAANNLLAVIGNKSITEITRDDALTFREWWEARVEDYGIVRRQR